MLACVKNWKKEKRKKKKILARNTLGASILIACILGVVVIVYTKHHKG